MKGLALFTGLTLFSFCTRAQEFAALPASNPAVPVKTITKEVFIPSNIQYTSIIKDLPKEAIDFCANFSKKTNYIQTIYTKGKKYFSKVNKIFSKYQIPTELNVLLPIESFFNKNCVSSAGAVGFWQFMDATAIEYGLNIDSAKDERKDFTKSTRAAARYLKAHYAQLKDWNLTVASYNCGLGNVKKAIARSGLSNPDFFAIKSFLPKETQNYVMKFIALNLLYKNYTLFSANKLDWYGHTEKITEQFIIEAPETITIQNPQH